VEAGRSGHGEEGAREKWISPKIKEGKGPKKGNEKRGEDQASGKNCRARPQGTVDKLNAERTAKEKKLPERADLKERMGPKHFNAHPGQEIRT